MQEVVLKLDLYEDKVKQKAMKTVAGIRGVNSVGMDMKDKKLTVKGDADPVLIVSKLRKLCHTDFVYVGPAKEPEKKKDEPKKDDQKKPQEQKKDSKDGKDNLFDPVTAYQGYNPYIIPYHYVRSVEEDPNACVIF